MRNEEENYVKGKQCVEEEKYRKRRDEEKGMDRLREKGWERRWEREREGERGMHARTQGQKGSGREGGREGEANNVEEKIDGQTCIGRLVIGSVSVRVTNVGCAFSMRTRQLFIKNLG